MMDSLSEVGLPGHYPYTRGISATPKPWIMGQYAGFASASESNKRFRALLAQGVTGFSVAMDLPTQLGLDSDDVLAQGEVGRVGVAIDSLADIEVLMDGIALEDIAQVRTTANSIGFLWTAFFIALAEKRGVNPNEFSLLIQNDVLKEFIARGTQIFPPGPSVKLTADTIQYCSENVPNWTPLAMSGYHIRESGASAAEEIAFTFANARAYIDECIDRGINVDSFAPSLFIFLSVGIEFLTEISKFRAARWLWAEMMREVYGATDRESEKLRIFAFTAGSTLTAQQPENNIARACIEALGAAIGGVQTLHVSAFDEALGVPTERAAKIGLRTQQIIAEETGLLNDVDIFGGAPLLEEVTRRIYGEAKDIMHTVQMRGGALTCVADGWFQRRIADGAYEHAREVESGRRRVVGVNKYQEPSGEDLDVFRIDPESERAQVERLGRLRDSRDSEHVRSSLLNLESVARSGANVVPAIVEAVKAYCTVGEIIDILKGEFGEYQPSSEF